MKKTIIALTLLLSITSQANPTKCVFSTSLLGNSVEDITLDDVKADGNARVILTAKSLNETWIISATKVAKNDLIITAIKSAALGDELAQTQISRNQRPLIVSIKEDGTASAATTMASALEDYSYRLFCEAQL